MQNNNTKKLILPFLLDNLDNILMDEQICEKYIWIKFNYKKYIINPC